MSVCLHACAVSVTFCSVLLYREHHASTSLARPTPPQAPHVCATWSEDGAVRLWDLSHQLATLHAPGKGGGAAGLKWRLASVRTSLHRPPRPSWRHGAPLRSPECSRGRLEASCGASKPARTRPQHDGSRPFNQAAAGPRRAGSRCTPSADTRTRASRSTGRLWARGRSHPPTAPACSSVSV